MISTVQHSSASANRHITRHLKQYRDCNGCPLSKCRSRVVLYRGTVPCEVLFIGEAPGHSEDTLGRPFVGEAGHCLQALIDAVDGEESFTYALTNIVACLPTSLPENEDADNGERSLRDPTPKEADACSLRLSTFIAISKPRMIVSLGRIAQKYLPLASPPRSIKILPLIHPSAIIHKTSILREIEERNFSIRLLRAIQEMHSQV